MEIVICASIGSTYKIKEIGDKLEKLGHLIEIPYMSQKILAGEISMEEFNKEKELNGDEFFRKNAQEDLIKRYYNKIKDSDAILVINIDKKGVKNHIGGNTLMEMGFAYILNKKIYLLNDIPEMSYMDEIKATKPIIINGDLSKIK